jgi:pseudouridine synthase
MLIRALSKLGLCSRQQAKRAIHAGRVKVNGKVVLHHTHWIDLARDVIKLDDQVVRGAEKLIYLVLYKPAGYVTTRRDNLGRPTVFDLLPTPPRAIDSMQADFSLPVSWIFPVGRLDYNSEGLLLFTNDGPLGDALASPQNHVPKVYRVLVDRLPSFEAIRHLEAGIRIRDYTTLPAKIEIDAQQALAQSSNEEGVKNDLRQNGYWLRITIREGKNRQVRRMLAAVGCEVRRLIRTRFGPLELGNLPVGQWRELTESEVQALRRVTENIQ